MSQERDDEDESLLDRLFSDGWLFFSNDQLFTFAMIALASLVRAMGVTVRSGEQALLFTFGRAGKVLEPGFRPLVPFLQVVRKMPSRSRTLDLPAQRVVTLEGLVFHVDANLVYRVIDIRRAIVEIDNLEKGMLQMLGLGVQEVLRQTTRSGARETDELSARLFEVLERRLEPWGVKIEQAGFTSITPSAVTLRLTQIRRNSAERGQAMMRFEARAAGRRRALGLLGSRRRYERRARRFQRLAETLQGRRRIRAELTRRGLSAADVAAVEKRGLVSLPGSRSSSFHAGSSAGHGDHAVLRVKEGLTTKFTTRAELREVRKRAKEARREAAREWIAPRSVAERSLEKKGRLRPTSVSRKDDARRSKVGERRR